MSPRRVMNACACFGLRSCVGSAPKLSLTFALGWRSPNSSNRYQTVRKIYSCLGIRVPPHVIVTGLIE